MPERHYTDSMIRAAMWQWEKDRRTGDGDFKPIDEYETVEEYVSEFMRTLDEYVEKTRIR